MQLYELLDKFEILFKDDERFADLRRFFIDKDENSFFRLLSSMTDSQIVDTVRKLHNDKNFNKDCISRGQVQSKTWLIEELQKINPKIYDLGTVFLCAGWYGTLATMLFESKIKIKRILSFDIDESCIKIAEMFNKPWYEKQWKFKALKKDIMEIDYNSLDWNFWSTKNNRMSYTITDTPDTIINTSCEHIKDFDKWYAKIPAGKLVILQSNDYFNVPEETGHVNCSKNLLEFEKQTPMSKSLYEGVLDLGEYNRFMRIGIR